MWALYMSTALPSLPSHPFSLLQPTPLPTSHKPTISSLIIIENMHIKPPESIFSIAYIYTVPELTTWDRKTHRMLSLEESDSPSLSSHWTPEVPHTGVKPCRISLSTLAWQLVSLLYQSYSDNNIVVISQVYFLLCLGDTVKQEVPCDSRC